jgi:hypothetical protein
MPTSFVGVLACAVVLAPLAVRAWLELDVSSEVIGLLLPLAAAVLAIMRVVITLATGGESTWTWASMVQTLSAPGNSLFYLTVVYREQSSKTHLRMQNKCLSECALPPLPCALLQVLKHKNDFGSIKLITLRELDAGIHALAIW